MDAETLTTAARAVLGIAFAVAGATKLADQQGVAAAAEQLGAPSGLARPVSRLLPAAELAVAGAMLWPSAVVPAAAIALFMLVAFTCLVVLNLRRGRRPPCHCFGRSGTPIGAGTLVRNLVLMAVAVTLLVAA
ncbi:MAG TPA: MauE/DoxX family redox-associated membrane protein [Acidimicrobiales bacterium]